MVLVGADAIEYLTHKAQDIDRRDDDAGTACDGEEAVERVSMLEGTDKNPFSLDSKEPDWSKFQDFLKGEVRFASLYKLFPERAEELLQKTEEFAKVRLETYKRLAGK